MKEELKDMEASGVIEPSVSEWAAPIVLVKDSSLHFCVDYRKLNGVARSDAYPMPRVDKLINRLGNASFITTLDLTRGYWQVPVEEKSHPLTAFRNAIWALSISHDALWSEWCTRLSIVHRGRNI